MIDVLRYIEKMKEMYEGERITAHGPRNMYAGGQLVRNTVDGSRPGYRGPLPTSKAFVEYVRGLDKKKTAKLNIDELIKMSGIDIKRDTALTQLRYNNPDIKFSFTKQGTDDPRTQAKIKKIQLEKVKVRTNTIKKVNNWTNNWFKNNASGFKDYDSAKKQLIKDFAEESKKKIYKGYNLTTVDGLPNIAAGSHEGTGAIKVSDTIFDLNFPTQRPNKELIFQKGYANYRLQNPKFAKKLNNYFDLVIMDKRGFNVQQMLIQEGKLKEGYGLIRSETGDFFGKGSKSMKGKKVLEALNIDREVLDFVTTYMAKDSPYFTKTGGENIYDILGKHIDPEKIATYKNKINVGTDQWRKNLEDVVKLANKDLPPPKHLSVDAIRSQMKKESKKMAKLFNLKDLPAELKYFGYSQDHLLGIREALESGDSRIARQTLKTIAAATRAQNTFLGFNEFGNQRRQLIKDFNAAPKNARGPIIEKLNTLSEEFVPGKLKYNVRKDGSLKINVLQPEKTFKARATAYGEITKTLPKNVQKILGNFWCGKKQSAAGGGRIGFSGSCPVEVKQKNFLRMTNDVANGKITGEAAEQIAKNAGKVVAKVGSKSALASIFGPAGIGLDIAYEVGSIGVDVAGGKSWNRALQDNWLTGAFISGTGQEEFHKELYAKDSKAKPYGQALDLVDAYNKAQKNIERIKQTVYRGPGQKEQALAVAERDLRGIEAQYNALTKQGKIMEEGSPEYENYMAAKTEFEDTAKAKSYAAETSLKYQLDAPESSRFTPREISPVKIDFNIPKGHTMDMAAPGAPMTTSFKPDLPTKENLNRLFQLHGVVHPRFGQAPEEVLDYMINQERIRQEMEQPGIRGSQDWKGADGGLANLTRTVAPDSGPMDQGLRSLYINDKDY